MLVPLIDHTTRSVEDLLVAPVRKQLEPQIVVRDSLEGQGILKRRFDLDAASSGRGSVVVGLGGFKEHYVVFEGCDDFAYVADEAAIDSERPVPKRLLEAC